MNNVNKNVNLENNSLYKRRKITDKSLDENKSSQPFSGGKDKINKNKANYQERKAKRTRIYNEKNKEFENDLIDLDKNRSSYPFDENTSSQPFSGEEDNNYSSSSESSSDENTSSQPFSGKSIRKKKS